MDVCGVWGCATAAATGAHQLCSPGHTPDFLRKEGKEAAAKEVQVVIASLFSLPEFSALFLKATPPRLSKDPKFSALFFAHFPHFQGFEQLLKRCPMPKMSGAMRP